MKVLYHGSNVSIERIDLSKSHVAKDFGCGFYLTEDKKQALDQAKNTVSRNLWGEPTVTAFLFDENLLTNGELLVKVFEDYTEE